MYCANCGANNDDRARYCEKCGNSMAGTASSAGGSGAAGSPHATRENVPNYLVQAILVTIFCCLPFGIVSIVYAAQVNGKVAAGDIAGARRAPSSAKTWAWVSFGVGLGSVVVWILIYGIAIMSAFAWS